MGLIRFKEERFQTIRSSLISHAIDHPDFRTELWDALHDTAIRVPDYSMRGLRVECRRFASGLWRANRVVVSHYGGPDYKGTPALSDGGKMLSAQTLLLALEDVEYNAVTPVPDTDAQRFHWDGWGPHPNHAVRVFQPVSLAVSSLWGDLERREKRSAPSLAT